jgi:hypothetical protein
LVVAKVRERLAVCKRAAQKIDTEKNVLYPADTGEEVAV